MCKRWSLDLQCQTQWAILKNTESDVRITGLGISVLRKRIRLHPATGLAEPLNILAVVYQDGGKMKFPIMYENSRVPVWLSKITPINVWANSFAFWVWFGVLSFIVSITGTMLAFASLTLRDPRANEEREKFGKRN